MINSCTPLQDCKIVHFLRHAEAESNAAAHKFERGSPGYNQAYEDSAFFDSSLSAKGEAQCSALREKLASSLPLHYDTVVCSPLRRTLQTAALVLANRGVPWLAVELAREFSNGHCRPCDRRRSREVQALRGFDWVDFRHVPPGDDTFDERAETHAQLDARISDLLTFLRELPGSSVVVVAHTGILTRLFSHHLRWQGAAAFENCELRSVVLSFAAAAEAPEQATAKAEEAAAAPAPPDAAVEPATS